MKTLLTLGLIVHFIIIGALAIRLTSELNFKKTCYLGLYFLIFHIAYLLFVKFNLHLVYPK